MAVLWSLRGLSWRELAKRTLRRSWEHEIFGQAARLAFYYFLGIFPALLLLLVLLNSLSITGWELRNTLLDYIQQIVPPEASALLAKTAGELNGRATVGTGALWAAPSAAWAIFNGTWAMMAGPEQRLWSQRRAPVVADCDHCFRADDFAGNHGSDGTGRNAIRQPGRDHDQPA